MKWLVDTNIWLYAAAKERESVDFLDATVGAEWTGYSAITRLELFGFPDLKPQDEGRLGELLGGFFEAEVNAAVIDRAIEIRRGRRIRSPDAIIAATALCMDATLVTRNTDDFKAVRGLRVMNPYTPAVGR